MRGGGEPWVLLELALRRGENLNSLTFYFKFCLFAKYGLWGFCFCFVFKGNEMEFKGSVSLAHSSVPYMVPAPGHLPPPASTLTRYSVLFLGSAGNMKRPQRGKQRLQLPAQPSQRLPSWGTLHSSSSLRSLLLHLFFFSPSGTETTVIFLFPCLIRQYPC